MNLNNALKKWNSVILYFVIVYQRIWLLLYSIMANDDHYIIIIYYLFMTYNSIHILNTGLKLAINNSFECFI